MKKYIFTIILSALPAILMAANDAPDAYFKKQNPKLTPQEKAAIAISQKWQAASNNPAGIKPVSGPEGSVLFIYGAQPISVVCAILQACDVELQPGEQVNNLHVGDRRVLVEPAISGVGAAEIQHLIIKPLDVGLETSIIVTTNRRTYHIRVRSHQTEFMPRVGFIYTEDALAKWDALKGREVKQKQEQTIPQTKEYLGDLNFSYEITGSAVWKPVRVYNDGTKTIIQMAPAMAQTEAPTLLVVRKDGGVTGEEETTIVNYQVLGDRYIVDMIFDKAILVSGVGSNQDRVTITKGK